MPQMRQGMRRCREAEDRGQEDAYRANSNRGLELKDGLSFNSNATDAAD